MYPSVAKNNSSLSSTTYLIATSIHIVTNLPKKKESLPARDNTGNIEMNGP